MAKYLWTSTSSTDPTVGANWTKASDGTTGTAPTTGDDVWIGAVAGLALANIGTSDMSAVTLSSLTISATYTGTIGTSAVTGGYWQISASTATIGTASADGTTATGSGRIKIDLGSVAANITVVSTKSSSSDSGYEPVRIIGSSSSNVLNVQSGRVGVATSNVGETATLSSVNLIGGTCDFGAGVTWTTGTVAGSGTLNTHSAGTTLTVSSGASAVCSGTVKLTTINCSGSVSLNNRPGSGNIADTLNLYGSGRVDFSANPASGSIGTLSHYRGGSYVVDAANPTHITATSTLKDASTITAS